MTNPRIEECKHLDTKPIGEIGGRFGDEWCRDCGALRSWDNYTSVRRDNAKWVFPTRIEVPRVINQPYGAYCSERVPDGQYKGYPCCAQNGHGDKHVITGGQLEPPGWYIIYEWE